MALVIMPFRLGEFARPYLVAERPHLRVSAALSSVVVERVADGLFTALMLMACLLAIPAGSPGFRVIRAGGFIMGAVFLVALAFLIVAYRSRHVAARFLERCLSPISPRLAARAAGVTEAFIHGLRIVPSRQQGAALLRPDRRVLGLQRLGDAGAGPGIRPAHGLPRRPPRSWACSSSG